jgi:hypothetical protein
MGRTRKEVVEDLNVALVAAGHSMRSASIALGLNHSYLSRFMQETGYSPDVLPEDVRLALARLIGIDEKILRISTPGGVFVNPSEGFEAHSETANRTKAYGTGKRTTDMRVDHLFQELGRIKERLDRLESESAPAGSHKKKGPARP